MSDKPTARERILAAAVRQIAEEGIDGVRIARIAMAAGVSTSLVHYHFDSRDALLAEAGTTRAKLVAVNVFLPHITDFDAMNEVYDAWVDRANPPTRACVEARLADPDLRVEMTAVAVL